MVVMTESEVALQAVERLRAWTPQAGDFAFVESAEVVTIDGHIGLEVRWTQLSRDRQQRRFGLLTTVRELMADADTHDPAWAAEALLIAVQEPHGSLSGDIRLVFRRLP
jgi:hypothetical protein